MVQRIKQNSLGKELPRKSDIRHVLSIGEIIMTQEIATESVIVKDPIPRHVEVGMEYGLIKLGEDLDSYLTKASFDPSGFECACAHGQQGAGKSNYMLQRVAAIKKASFFRDHKRFPTERELWDLVLKSIVFTPTDFIEKLEQIKEIGERIDVVLWDDIQLEYTSSTFKTNIDQYSAIDSMMAVIRTKCAITLITIPNITRLPKNVKDNVTFEVFVGKNRKVQIRRLFRLPGQKRIDSNLFKPIIQRPRIFDLYAIPPWAWKKYEGMRQNIANKALANLKEATDMEDETAYTKVWELGSKLSISANTIQQMGSRGIIPTKMVRGALCVPTEFVPNLLERYPKKE